MKLFTVKEMIVAEKTADSQGTTYAQMMETAGRSLAQAIIDRYPMENVSILLLIGPGNNGGDGLVAGRYLAEAGANVAFYLFKPRDPATDPNFAKIQQMGLFIVEASHDQRFRVLRTRLKITDILIDGLLGTGVTRPIAGDLAKLMRQTAVGLTERRNTLAKQSSPQRLEVVHPLTPSPQQSKIAHPFTNFPHTVAIDCPSGLNCDTGALDPLALHADLTVTFAGPKRGHFSFPGAAAVGELVVADIGITPEMVSDVPVEVATSEMAQSLLPKRPADGHKGTFGKILIAAGCDLYRGAPLLAARGAFRAGAGLVALAVPTALRLATSIALPEATYLDVEDEVGLTAVTAQRIHKQRSSHTALLVGPGLGAADDFIATLFPPEKTRFLQETGFLIIDADGLNCLARLPNWWQRLPPHTVLTPHLAEMARLMAIPLAEMKTLDRIETARTQAQKWGHVVLLKGAYTVVAAPDGRATLLPFANPVLAVGGSGDVLSGVIAALLGQGVPPYDAARLGGFLHGMAGEVSGRSAGLFASEIADQLPTVLTTLYP